MILAAFNVADKLCAFVDHNLCGLAHDIRIRVNANCLHDEIETVFLRLTLSIQERPILPLSFHFLTTNRGYTFLDELGFLNTPGLIDFRGIHRHTIRACTNHIERPIFFGSTNIKFTCHRQLLSFTIFRHFREETHKLDVIAANRIGRENLVDFDVSEVLSVGLVLQLEILGGDVADLTSVGDNIDLEDVFLVGKISFGDVNGNACETLFYDLVMNPTGIGGDACLALGVWERAKHESRYIAQDHAAKSVCK